MALKSKASYQSTNLDSVSGELKNNNQRLIGAPNSRAPHQDAIDYFYPQILNLTSVSDTPYTLVYGSGVIRIYINTNSDIFEFNLPEISAIKPDIFIYNIGTSGNKVRIIPTGTTINGLAEIALYDGEDCKINDNASEFKATINEKPRTLNIDFSDSPYNLVIDRINMTVSGETSGGEIIVNLPTFSGVKSTINIKNKGLSGNNIVTDGYQTETIEGELSQAVSDGSNMPIQPCLTEWSIL
jgi:hypothetical protein